MVDIQLDCLPRDLRGREGWRHLEKTALFSSCTLGNLDKDTSKIVPRKEVFAFVLPIGTSRKSISPHHRQSLGS